ncbi:MAG: flavodoxin-dependent (E)-4-hydroxy-3-methylbut-2-enyl-diphosphate synthase [Firmicutes bacterium]|nr:flavodoxin-dependent (E)-4-hydroxy-3-methylbut-2-enyl-diphosphate synthase [Bacillota bacterium]
MYKRHEVKKISVGALSIGGSNQVIIQSMTTTLTKDTASTIKQIQALESVGCEMVRLAILDLEDAKAIGFIKRFTHIPLVADIHYNYLLAIEAVNQGIDKIRINPGNIGSDELVKLVVDKCLQKNIPIRIGINSGSIEKHILDKYGSASPEAMIESAKYHISLLERLGFFDIVLSLKSTNMEDTIQANRMASQIFPYPLHLGITEAGTIFSGTIRSSVGLGILLSEGIGSTIRVSLTASPEEEIKVAKEILSNFNLYRKPKLISCPTCGRIQYDMIPIANEIEAFLTTINKEITVAIMGCAVNGPGEAREANIAIAGGLKEAILYIDGIKVKKVKQEQLIEALKEAIINY